jgi:hypothetical protein
MCSPEPADAALTHLEQRLLIARELNDAGMQLSAAPDWSAATPGLPEREILIKTAACAFPMRPSAAVCGDDAAPMMPARGAPAAPERPASGPMRP